MEFTKVLSLRHVIAVSRGDSIVVESEEDQYSCKQQNQYLL